MKKNNIVKNLAKELFFMNCCLVFLGACLLWVLCFLNIFTLGDISRGILTNFNLKDTSLQREINGTLYLFSIFFTVATPIIAIKFFGYLKKKGITYQV